jgi:hypothetical protein
LVLSRVQKFEKFATSAEVRDDINGTFAEEDILDLDNVGVIKTL